MPAFIKTLLLSLVAAVAFGKPVNDWNRTPVLGFNTYNDVACSPNASYVSQRLEELRWRGFHTAGYRLFHLDCGWAGFERLPNGSITWDATRFPQGIAPLSQKANRLGFDWGMYTDTGLYMCDTAGFDDVKRPASRDHEYEDAVRFKQWNATYVKVDNCWLSADSQGNHDPRTDYVDRYGRFSKAFDQVGIPLLAVCQWATPYVDPQGKLKGLAEWTGSVGTSYRVADDVYHSWYTVYRVWNEALNVNKRGLNGPGNFIDMDILEVGNDGLTVPEQQTHFVIWATFKSSLLVSTDLSSATAATLRLVLNKDLLAINQDSLGKPVTLIQRFTNDHDVYTGPLSNGDIVVVLSELSNAQNTLNLTFSSIGIKSASVKNLLNGRTYRNLASWSSVVDPHGSVALRLSNIQLNTSAPVPRHWYEGEDAVFSNGAGPHDCSGCSGGKAAANLCADDSSYFWSGLSASSSVLDVSFDYINAQYAVGDDNQNIRGATIVVNGGEPQQVEFPFTGYDYDTALWKDYLVRLKGFVPGTSNNMTVTRWADVSTCGPRHSHTCLGSSLKC